MTDISAALIVKNEEAVLGNCLMSLECFDEVIVYLNDCTDSSKTIAEKHSNVKVVEGPLLGFSATRNTAANAAANNWIFAIDADERCSPELVMELGQIAAAAEVKVIATFMGKQLATGSFNTDWRARLYDRRKTTWERPVNESLAPTENVHPRLYGILFHHEPPVRRQLEKNRHYAKIQANAGKPRYHPAIALTIALYRFIKHMVFSLAFLEGKAGLVHSLVISHRFYVKSTVPPDKNQH